MVAQNGEINMSLAGGIVRNVPGARRFTQYISDRVTAGRTVAFHPTYNQDNLATDHYLTTDARFENAYSGAMAMGLALSDETKWRVHVACWAASVGQKLGGAFVECGVAKGFMSRVIIDYLDLKEPFYLLDTYNGLDERFLSPAQVQGLLDWQQKNGGKAYYQDSYDQVVSTFSDQPQVKVIRGAVPETLSEVDADRIAYLSLDMNCAMPEIEAMDYFWPKMVSGAYVVLDDYGWQGHDEQREAFIDWSKRNNAPLLSLPTGQGLFVKA